MNFVITIKYKVDSKKTINKKISYEYYKKEEKIHYDRVEFTDSTIKIRGSRYNDISLHNCMQTKRSNYKHCLLSSLFYIYNYFGKKIDVESIVMEKFIPGSGSQNRFDRYTYHQEFNYNELPKELRIDSSLIEYLFKKHSYQNVATMLYNVLLSQVLYMRDYDFYYAYRGFNSGYTYLYSYHPDFQENSNRDKNADREAIIKVLKLDNLSNNLTNSIKMSEDYFANSGYNLFNSNIGRLSSDTGKFLSMMGFDAFEYEDENLLNFIEEIFEEKYKLTIEKHLNKLEEEYLEKINQRRELNAIQEKTEDNKKEIKQLDKQISRLNQQKIDFSKFRDKLNVKGISKPINILQFLIIYAQYKRNKTLHGEQFDSLFFLHDINVDEINELSRLIFQTCVELVNQISSSNCLC